MNRYKNLINHLQKSVLLLFHFSLFKEVKVFFSCGIHKHTIFYGFLFMEKKSLVRLTFL